MLTNEERLLDQGGRAVLDRGQVSHILGKGGGGLASWPRGNAWRGPGTFDLVKVP